MNALGPQESLNRSKALASLFPGRLPPGFASYFRPEEFSRDAEIPIEARIELFRIRAGKDNKQQSSINRIWEEIFIEKLSSQGGRSYKKRDRVE
jgi:hypothetical protein